MAKNVDHTVAIMGSVAEAGDTWIRVDPETSALVTISWENYLIHKGMLYTIAYMHFDVPDDGNADLIVAVGGKMLHTFKARWWSDGKSHLTLYGGTEYSGGVEIEPVNMLVGTNGGLETKFFAGPVVSDVGDPLFPQLLPGGVQPFKYEGYHEIAYEWVLPANAPAFMVRVTNKSGTPSDIAYQLVSYEG